MHKSITIYTRFALLMICAGLLPATSLSGQPTFKNPVITGMNPDRGICRVDSDFYQVTLTFEYFPGLPVYHSKDLVHWELIGHTDLVRLPDISWWLVCLWPH